MLSGADAFKLYDTYGFPPELTEEMLAEKGYTYDKEAFATEMENQRNRARAARGESNYMGAADTVFNQLGAALSTEFAGYETLTSQSKVIAMAVEQELKNEAEEGDSVAIFLDKTPFYAESGGQKGDSGILEFPNGKVAIFDCQKVAGSKIAHIGEVIEGSIKAEEALTAQVAPSQRLMTMRNHTATHLLNKALRTVLGEHIEQAGSEVSAERLRFDFTHFASATPQELRAIEDEVNTNIFAALGLLVKEMPMDEARKAGAVMLMGEKGENYGDLVRVVNIGNGKSVELCGGTHLENTAQIGLFKLTSEGSVAAGVRRIEAVTGEAALAQYRQAEDKLNEVAAAMKTKPDQLLNRAQSLNAELRQVKQELETLKSKQALNQAGEILDKKEEHGGLTLLSANISGLDATALRNMGDQLKEKVDVLLLSSATDSAVQFIAHASKKAVEAGVHAGNIVKEAAKLCGGNGGGRPNSAQAGGKDASKAEEALKAGIALAKNQIGG